MTLDMNTLWRRMILRFAGICLLLHAGGVLAQDYPPSGQRLRVLAEAADFQIGYASRYDFRNQRHAALYERLVKAEFNIVTPENSLKWELVHPFKDHYDFSDMDELVEFAEQNAMALHGHPLLWYFQNPPWLETLSAAELEQQMLAHITRLVSRYKGRIQVWDVINEALAATDQGGGLQSNIWSDALGESYIAKAFTAARAADPDASLIYNETGVGWLTPKSDEMYELVTRLLDQGVPIDGVGFQMHISHRFNEYEELSDDMQRYAELGLDIYITEFDVSKLMETDPEIQADVYEGVIRRCMAQPRCQALQIWGVDDFNSWRPFFDPLPFDDEFRVKPAYYGMQRALSTRFLQPEEHISNTPFSAQSGSVSAGPGGGSIRFNATDMNAGYRSATLRYASSALQPAVVELRAVGDSDTAVSAERVLGRWQLPPTGNTARFTTAQIDIAQSSGSPDLLLVFAENTQALALDWLSLDAPQQNVQQPVQSTSGAGAGGLLLLLLLAGAAWRCRRDSGFFPAA